jgi:DNA-binding CsgD family transcriptional regulator
MCINVCKRPTEKTIAKWIADRARRMGFRGHDIEDVQQQILMVLMDFEFSPDKSNGASIRTAITSIIDRQLRFMRRTRLRYSDHVSGSENLPSDVADTSHGVNASRRISLLEDLATARSQLSPLSQSICDALSEGHSINEIAQTMGISWHTVQKHVGTIRECFASFGLGNMAT